LALCISGIYKNTEVIGYFAFLDNTIVIYVAEDMISKDIYQICAAVHDGQIYFSGQKSSCALHCLEGDSTWHCGVP
jgi:hypothetical protein